MRALRVGYYLWLLGPAGLCAYLTLQGVSALMRPSLQVSSEHQAQVARTAQLSQHTRTGSAILKRNPFDSKTGPLGEHLIKPPKKKVPPPNIDPLSAPTCEGIVVSATAELADAEASMAVIRAAGDQHGRLRRTGDNVGSKRIEFIGRNPLAQSPAVWFSENGELCQALLFDGAYKGAPAVANTAPPPNPATSSSPFAVARSVSGPGARPVVSTRSETRRPLPAETAESIQQTGDSEVHIEASVAERIVKDYVNLTRGAKLVPAREEGRMVGMRLSGVETEGLLDRLGLREGDRLESINGFSLATPLGALQAYAALRKASDLQLHLTRAGRAVYMNFRIR